MVLWGLGWFLAFKDKKRTSTLYKVQLLTEIWNVWGGAVMDLFSGNAGKNLRLFFTELIKFLESLKTEAQITLQGTTNSD